MGRTMKRGTAFLAALFCAVTILSMLLPLRASANGNSESVNHFNVMLVIDGSGSLINRSSATDPSGLRYDALDLFLALLTNGGNNVGAIVFDHDSQNYLLNTGLQNINGRADKLDLSQQIRDAGTRGDTDIGSALLTAVQTVCDARQANGMDSVIILFSDGRTALSTGGEEAYEASLANKEAAIVMAQEEGIPVYSVCLAATSVADPAELQEISDRTSGHAVAVQKAEDLKDAFSSFYDLIFGTSSTNTIDTVFPESGELEMDIPVPSYGAEEVNVILDHTNLNNLELASPTRVLSASELDDATMYGGNYQVVKVSDPESGQWHLTLKGDPGSRAMINVVYNINSTVQLTTSDGQTEYAAGDTVTLEAFMFTNGTQVMDDRVTAEYDAELTIISGGQDTRTEMMTPAGSGKFTYTIDEADYGSIQAQVTLSSNDVHLQSTTLSLNFGNSAPVVADGNAMHTEKVLVTPVSGRSRSYDLNTFFSDPQGDPLTYTLVSSQLVQDTAQLDGNKLNVDTSRSKSGDVVLRATDSQGASTDMTIRFRVTNLTIPIVVIVLGAILAAAIIGFIVWMAARPVFKGTIKVDNVNASYDSVPRTHAAFRGKLKLSRLMIPETGLDVNKCYFLACRGNRVEFHSKKPFYINGAPTTQTTILGGTEIFADEAMTQGIRVDLEFDNYF